VKAFIPGIMAAAALGVSYFTVIESLVHQWLANDDFSHGILIVPVAVYLGWQKRGQLMAVPIRTDWRALSLMLVAGFVYVVGELGAELFTVRVSLLLFVIGFTWLLYGPAILKVLRFPLAFLFLMLPLPGFIYRNLTFPLQLVSSKWSVQLLQLAGVSAYREGNVIDLGFMTLQVVEACNGLRFILPLLTLGVLFAYFGRKALWKRLLLVAATVPIAMLANVLRISGTGILAAHWSPEAAEGFFHSFSGWLLFMVCFLLFALFNLVLTRLPRREPQVPAHRLLFQATPDRAPVSWAATAVALSMILVMPWAVESLGNVPRLQLKKPLDGFPLSVDGWSGQRDTLDPAIWRQVGGQEYLIIDYNKNGERPINFYVAYYEYQRKAGDFVHSPRLCLPGGGWFVESDRVRKVPSGTETNPLDRGLRLNELIISKNDTRQMAYFWYQGRGRNFTSEFEAKFYMVWDGLWRRRTDGALVRLVAPLGSAQDEAEARRTLDGFATRVAGLLEEHLP
jgi:exosortase D (VPLPA-CTERM-specific)